MSRWTSAIVAAAAVLLTAVATPADPPPGPTFAVADLGSGTAEDVKAGGRIAKTVSWLNDPNVAAGPVFHGLAGATVRDDVGTPFLAKPDGGDAETKSGNSTGEVVGHCKSKDAAVAHATLWDAVGAHDLNSMLDASGAGWVLLDAIAIHDSGEIVGVGTLDGQPHAFLLTPNIPPFANPGDDQTVECAGANTSIALDGSASVVSHDRELTYRWSGDFVGGTAAGVRPTVSFANGLGAHVVKLVVNDGRFDSSPETSTVTIDDTIAPTVTIASPGEGAIVGSNPVALLVEVIDATQTQVVAGLSSASVAPGDGPVSLSATLVPGPNTITVTATDQAGNVTSATRTVTYDPDAPLVRIDCPTPGQVFGVGASPVAVLAHVDDLGETSVVSSPTGVARTFVAGGGVVTGAIGLHEGSNTITIRATSAARHIGAASVTVVLDTTAPSLTVTDVPATLATDHTMARIRPTVIVSDAVDPAPVVAVAVACNEALVEGDVVVRAPTDIELRADAGRIYTLTFTATDRAGNRSTVVATATVPRAEGK